MGPHKVLRNRAPPNISVFCGHRDQVSQGVSLLGDEKPLWASFIFWILETWSCSIAQASLKLMPVLLIHPPKC